MFNSEMGALMFFLMECGDYLCVFQLHHAMSLENAQKTLSGYLLLLNILSIEEVLQLQSFNFKSWYLFKLVWNLWDVTHMLLNEKTIERDECDKMRFLCKFLSDTEIEPIKNIGRKLILPCREQAPFFERLHLENYVILDDKVGGELEAKCAIHRLNNPVFNDLLFNVDLIGNTFMPALKEATFEKLKESYHFIYSNLFKTGAVQPRRIIALNTSVYLILPSREWLIQMRNYGHLVNVVTEEPLDEIPMNTWLVFYTTPVHLECKKEVVYVHTNYDKNDPMPLAGTLTVPKRFAPLPYCVRTFIEHELKTRIHVLINTNDRFEKEDEFNKDDLNSELEHLWYLSGDLRLHSSMSFDCFKFSDDYYDIKRWDRRHFFKESAKVILPLMLFYQNENFSDGVRDIVREIFKFMGGPHAQKEEGWLKNFSPRIGHEIDIGFRKPFLFRTRSHFNKKIQEYFTFDSFKNYDVRTHTYMTRAFLEDIITNLQWYLEDMHFPDGKCALDVQNDITEVLLEYLHNNYVDIDDILRHDVFKGLTPNITSVMAKFHGTHPPKMASLFGIRGIPQFTVYGMLSFEVVQMVHLFSRIARPCGCIVLSFCQFINMYVARQRSGGVDSLGHNMSAKVAFSLINGDDTFITSQTHSNLFKDLWSCVKDNHACNSRRHSSYLKFQADQFMASHNYTCTEEQRKTCTCLKIDDAKEGKCLEMMWLHLLFDDDFTVVNEDNSLSLLTCDAFKELVTYIKQHLLDDPYSDFFIDTDNRAKVNSIFESKHCFC